MDKSKNTIWNIIQVVLASPWFWTLLTTAGLIIWQYLKGWFVSIYAPLTIPIVFLTIGAVFFFINQIQQYKKRNISNYEALITKWLLDSGIRIKKVLEHDDKILWVLETVSQFDSNPIKVGVFKQTPSVLILGIGRLISKEEQEDLARYILPADSTLIEELQMEMNRVGIGYTNIDKPLTSMELNHEILLDNTLNQVFFLKEFNKMRHAFALISNTIKKYKKLHPVKS
jgi:hypothetical protein